MYITARNKFMAVAKHLQLYSDLLQVLNGADFVSSRFSTVGILLSVSVVLIAAKEMRRSSINVKMSVSRSLLPLGTTTPLFAHGESQMRCLHQAWISLGLTEG